MKKISLLICLIIFQSCFENIDDPVVFLKNFVKKSASGKLTKSEYKDFVGGKLLTKIENLNEEDFKDYSSEQKVKGLKVKILNENCSSTKCTITYTTSYHSKTADGSKYKTEVRKLAELEKEETWKLLSIQNIKTFHETDNALNPLED